MRHVHLPPARCCCAVLLALAIVTSAQDGSNVEIAETGQGDKKPAAKLKVPDPVQPRLDINEISAMADTNKYKIVMLLAWQEMTSSSDTSDPLGLWALAGVHGLSWSYQGQQPASRDGFCRHSSPDFGPWHRPYLVQFEKGLQAAGSRAVMRIRDRTVRQEYMKVLRTIRLPYWDWTNRAVPSLLTDTTVQVVDAAGISSTIPNPFLNYRYPHTVGGGRGQVISRGSGWASVMANTASSHATQMRSLVASRDWSCTYDGFSSSWRNRCPGNLELTHNNIHNILGGTTGEMATVGYAGFDPLFWLHHAMIDRVLWLFQNNGGGWQGAASYVPFTDLQGDSSNLKAYNYTYRDPLGGEDLPGGRGSSNNNNNRDNKNNGNDRWNNFSWGSARGRRRLLQARPDALPMELEVPDSGTEVGSPAALAAVRRQVQYWSLGPQGYTWNIDFRHIKKNLPGVDEAINSYVFIKDLPADRGCPPFPAGPVLEANLLRLRPDYCGAVAGFRDIMERVRDRTHTASVDLTNCVRAAGTADVAPVDPADITKGPAGPAIRLSQLRLVALTASGLDVTEQFDFGDPVISWALAVPQMTVRTAPGILAVDGDSNSSGLYSLVQGSFE